MYIKKFLKCVICPLCLWHGLLKYNHEDCQSHFVHLTLSHFVDIFFFLQRIIFEIMNGLLSITFPRSWEFQNNYSSLKSLGSSIFTTFILWFSRRAHSSIAIHTFGEYWKRFWGLEDRRLSIKVQDRNWSNRQPV